MTGTWFVLVGGTLGCLVGLKANCSGHHQAKGLV